MHTDRFKVVAKGEVWQKRWDDRSVLLFNETCDRLDRPDILWLPSMGEVIADEPIDHLLLDTLRRDCEGAVSWHKFNCEKALEFGDCDCEIDFETAIGEKYLTRYIATV
jgi:hypothetical protein